jgi:hypothetical protein
MNHRMRWIAACVALTFSTAATAQTATDLTCTS